MTPLAVSRFWARVDKSGACWIWTGGKTSGGYGHLQAQGKNLLSHRVAYELLVGPIPVGLQIDHLCRVRACCNPAHLEPVTARENVRRSNSVTASNARKTHCVRGHVFDAQNTRFLEGGGRTCIPCKAQRQREAAARKPPGRPYGSWFREKTHCPQGHAYDEINTYLTPSGSRACRTCRNAASARHRQRRAAA